MNMKKAVPLALVAALSTGLGASAVAATDVLQISPDGSGGGVITADILDWTVGNAASFDATGIATGTSREFDTVTHGVLGNFSKDNAPVVGTGLNVDYEWTFVMGFRETGIAVTDAVLALSGVNGAPSYFEVYHDPALNADMTAGTGFNDGTLVMSGEISSSSGVFDITAFLNGGAVPVALDAFGNDDYPGQLTIEGIGGANVKVDVLFHDANYILNVPGALTSTFNTTQKLAYEETDPSASFVMGSAAEGHASTIPDIGSVNGFDGLDVIFQTDPNQSFVIVPVEEPIACRFTGGGVDTDMNWDHTLENGEMVRNGSSQLPPGIDRYTFGGQAGANTAQQPQPKGVWTHHQQVGPSGSFVFHGGTSSAPAGTEIVEIRCSDEGWCQQARPAPAKQLDFDGIGTFNNLSSGNGKNRVEANFDIPNPTVTAEGKGNKNFDGTFHWFEVNIDDLGEPGNLNSGAPDSAACPSIGFGEKGALNLANCDCPDFYRITIYDGVYASDVVWTADGQIDQTSLNKTTVIYEAYGYIDGGNLQIHPPTGFDSN